MANMPYAIVVAAILAVTVLVAIGTLGKELTANQSSAITQTTVSH